MIAINHRNYDNFHYRKSWKSDNYNRDSNPVREQGSNTKIKRLRAITLYI